MSLLKQVIKGKIESPLLVLVYGPHGIGKSTFGAGSPNPIFIGPEQGTNNLDVARFPTPKSWSDITNALAELATEPHDFKTVVVDSLDWLELLVHQKVMTDYRVKSIELAAGGYGKGYIEARNIFKDFIDQLNVLRNQRGMNIVLIAHSQITKFEDPNMQTAYDRFSIKLHKKSAELFQEYVDAILFCTYKTQITTDGDAVRAFSSGERVLLTTWMPGRDAKNRYGLPDELGLSWNDFASAISTDTVDAVLKRIEADIPQLSADKQEAARAHVEKVKTSKDQLLAFEKKIKLILGVTNQ